MCSAPFLRALAYLSALTLLGPFVARHDYLISQPQKLWIREGEAGEPPVPIKVCLLETVDSRAFLQL